MAAFEPAITVVLKHEGGFVNNVNDAGGATNYGISLRFLRDYPGDGDFDGDGDVDIDDIRKMTLTDAKAIYRKHWWDKYKYEKIVDQTIATKALDLSVNMGASRAHKLLQAAINKAFRLNLVVDGALGNASFGAINALATLGDRQKLLTAYADEAWGFYQQIIRKTPSQKVFERGWKNRAYSLTAADSVK